MTGPLGETPSSLRGSAPLSPPPCGRALPRRPPGGVAGPCAAEESGPPRCSCGRGGYGCRPGLRVCTRRAAEDPGTVRGSGSRGVLGAWGWGGGVCACFLGHPARDETLCPGVAGWGEVIRRVPGKPGWVAIRTLQTAGGGGGRKRGAGGAGSRGPGRGSRGGDWSGCAVAASEPGDRKRTSPPLGSPQVAAGSCQGAREGSGHGQPGRPRLRH